MKKIVLCLAAASCMMFYENFAMAFDCGNSGATCFSTLNDIYCNGAPLGFNVKNYCGSTPSPSCGDDATNSMILSDSDINSSSVNTGGQCTSGNTSGSTGCKYTLHVVESDYTKVPSTALTIHCDATKGWVVDSKDGGFCPNICTNPH